MIKYHVLALLCLVAAAISAVEFLAISMTQVEGSGSSYLESGRFWLMIGVFGFSIMMYFRVRRLRKLELEKGQIEMQMGKSKKGKSK